jgi:O-antigen ligase
LNWQTIRTMNHVQVGAVLALLIVVFLPNYNILKYGPSPAVPAFLLAVLGAWLLWRERLRVFATLAMRRWAIIFLLLFIPALASVPSSYDFRTSAGTVAGLALYFFCGVALVRALRSVNERVWLAKWITIVLLFWMADSGIQYLFGYDLFGIAVAKQGRILGPFAENLNQSVLLLLLMPIMLWWQGMRSTAGTLAVFLAAGVVAMLGGARTIFLWLGIVATALLIRLPGRRWKWGTVVVILVVLASTLAISPALQERFGRFAKLGTVTVNFGNLDLLLSRRLTLWDTGLNMIRERPVTGVGVGAFRVAYDHYSTISNDAFYGPEARQKPHHAHQLYIGSAAETGLPGLAALILAITLCIKWYREAPPLRRDQAWPYAVGLLVYAFPFNTQPVLFSRWLFPVMVLLLCGMLAALDDDRAGNATEKPAS